MVTTDEESNIEPRLVLMGAIDQLHPSSRRLMEILQDAGALHLKKSADYGGKKDPFANLKAAEEFGVPNWVGAAIRANDKMKRIQSFSRKGSLANESVQDAFTDLLVYSAICLVLYEEESREAVSG